MLCEFTPIQELFSEQSAMSLILVSNLKPGSLYQQSANVPGTVIWLVVHLLHVKGELELLGREI